MKSKQSSVESSPCERQDIAAAVQWLNEFFRFGSSPRFATMNHGFVKTIVNQEDGSATRWVFF